MGDIGDVYEATRKEIASFVSTLSEDELARRVPATPDWTIRDVISHLTGDVVSTVDGDFPREFFASFGSDEGIAKLNEWTDRQVRERRGRRLQEVLDEWESATPELLPRIRGEEPWPDPMMTFAGHILVTDIAIHQQDIYGALGILRDRDSAAVKIGLSTYIGGIQLRMGATPGDGTIRFVTETKDVVCGSGEPTATVKAGRFELFRALSGRRSPEQIRNYEWDGDPEPFTRFFYPYGVRAEALAE